MAAPTVVLPPSSTGFVVPPPSGVNAEVSLEADVVAEPCTFQGELVADECFASDGGAATVFSEPDYGTDEGRITEKGQRLFVGGLPQNATSEDLKIAFRKYGDLAEAEIIRDRQTGRSRNFGFVVLADKEMQSKALAEGIEVAGRKVTVKVQDGKQGGNADYPSPGKPYNSDKGDRKVFVGRLEPHHDQSFLSDTFSQRFGKVQEVFHAANKNYGFVTFVSSIDARAALKVGTLQVGQANLVIKSADPMRETRTRSDRDRSRSPPRDHMHMGAMPPAGCGAYPPAYGACPSYPGYGYPPPGCYPPPSAYSYPQPPPNYGYPQPTESSAYGAYGYSYHPGAAAPGAPPPGTAPSSQLPQGYWPPPSHMPQQGMPSACGPPPSAAPPGSVGASHPLAGYGQPPPNAYGIPGYGPPPGACQSGGRVDPYGRPY